MDEKLMISQFNTDIAQAKQLGLNVGAISDGYHTFDQLYEHRIVLYIALARFADKKVHNNVWKSKLHSDGTHWDGWFILGIGTEAKSQITYHLPDKYWDECKFAELSQAPPFDGHMSEQVLERIKELN